METAERNLVRSAPAQATPVLTIADGLATAEQACDSLAGQISELESKLCPVLATTPAASISSSPRETSSPVAEQLALVCQRIEDMTQRLAELRSRVDLTPPLHNRKARGAGPLGGCPPRANG